MIMQKDALLKKCDACGLYLESSEFYKNKSKNDGMQGRCKDCMKDYKVKLKQGLIQRNVPIRQDLYYIPDIFLVGYGRNQTYQNCCLRCNTPFFCLIETRQLSDLFCDDCSPDNVRLPDRNLSSVNFVGNVIGWLAKTESPAKKRSQRNYKKCYERDKYTCQYCGYNLHNAKKFLPLHVDHIKPFSAHGGNGLTNLVVSCQECNLMVSDKWFNTFEDKKEFIIFEKQKKVWRENHQAKT